jgi:hypothetical protein
MFNLNKCTAHRVHCRLLVPGRLFYTANQILFLFLNFFIKGNVKDVIINNYRITFIVFPGDVLSDHVQRSHVLDSLLELLSELLPEIS